MVSGGDCAVHNHPNFQQLLQQLDFGLLTVRDVASKIGVDSKTVYYCLANHLGSISVPPSSSHQSLQTIGFQPLSEQDLLKNPLEFFQGIINDMKFKYLQVSQLSIVDPVESRTYLNFLEVFRKVLADIVKLVGSFSSHINEKYKEAYDFSDKLTSFLAFNLCSECSKKVVEFIQENFEKVKTDE